jgi:hypothetical protein
MLSKIFRKRQKNHTHDREIVDCSLQVLTSKEEINTNKVFPDFNDSLNEKEGLLIELKRQTEILHQLQLKISRIIDQRRRMVVELEDGVSLTNERSRDSNFKLFLVETWGSAWTDSLVFTVMADNEVWAKHVVREWLKANGREDHRIDKIRALVSNDLRAVVNVGSKLLDV